MRYPRHTPIIALLLCSLAPSATAQSSASSQTPSLSLGDAAQLTPPHPQSQREVISRLSQIVNVSWHNAPLTDVFAQLEQTSGLTIIPMWLQPRESQPAPVAASPAKASGGATDADAKPPAVPQPPIEQRIGLRPDVRITVRAERVTLRHAIELALLKADAQATTPTIGSTWQLGAANTLQVGPRERLDRFVRLDTYDVTDLLLVIRDFRYDGPKFIREAPTSAFPSHAGFEDTRSADARAESLRQLIMDTCEPASWIELGGESATIRYDRGSKSMVVRAPDYVHRAIDGYRWDPAAPADIGEPVPASAPRQRPANPSSAGS